jgi:hypothetical protein
VSRRKHPKQETPPDEAAEPNPNPEADEGALWSEPAEAASEAKADAGDVASQAALAGGDADEARGVGRTGQRGGTAAGPGG